MILTPPCWYPLGKAAAVELHLSRPEEQKYRVRRLRALRVCWLRLCCSISRAKPRDRGAGEQIYFPLFTVRNPSEVHSLLLFCCERPYGSATKNKMISIPKWNIYTPWDRLRSANQSSYNSWTPPFLYISECPYSNSPSLLSSRFDRVMSSAKITSSTPVPLEMECRWCRRFNQWEVKVQITDNTPWPHYPRSSVTASDA